MEKSNLVSYEYKPGRAAGKKGSAYDDCQTPPYAVEPLIPILKASGRTMYDPAMGEGVIVRTLEIAGLDVLGTDIQTGDDFFNLRTDLHHDTGHTIVTNPPYSIKYDWLLHCFMLGEPFALLMPVEVLGSGKAQNMMEAYGRDWPMHIVFTQPRVDFLMPNLLWSGNGSQFPVAWFTWKIPLPRQMTFVKLNKPQRANLALYWLDALQWQSARLVTQWIKPNKVGGAQCGKVTELMYKRVNSWNGVRLVADSIEPEYTDRNDCRIWYTVERE